MREFEDRFGQRSASTNRVIGAARASTNAPRSATPWPISASSASRPTTSPSSASSTARMCRKRGLGETAIRQILDASRCAGARRMLEAAAKLAESDEIKPKPRAGPSSGRGQFRPLVGALTTRPTPSWPRSCWKSPATPRCGRKRPLGGSPRPARQPQGAGSAPWRITNFAASPSSSMWRSVNGHRAERREGRRLPS